MLVELQERAGVVDGGLDLEPIAHNAGVGHETSHVLGAVAGNALGVEGMEGGAKVFPLAQDGQPRQARLEALEHQLLKQRALIGLGYAPFLVVVARILGIGDADPGTALWLARRHTASVRGVGAIAK